MVNNVYWLTRVKNFFLLNLLVIAILLKLCDKEFYYQLTLKF